MTTIRGRVVHENQCDATISTEERDGSITIVNCVLLRLHKGDHMIAAFNVNYRSWKLGDEELRKLAEQPMNDYEGIKGLIGDEWLSEPAAVNELTLKMMQKMFAKLQADAEKPYVPPPLIVSIEGRDRLLKHDIRDAQGYCLRCKLPAWTVAYMNAPGTRTCGPESDALFEQIIATIRGTKQVFDEIEEAKMRMRSR